MQIVLILLLSNYNNYHQGRTVTKKSGETCEVLCAVYTMGILKSLFYEFIVCM